jgi:hypothetical protein
VSTPLSTEHMVEILTELDELFRAKPREGDALKRAARAYHGALNDYPLEAVQYAAKQAMKESKYFPMPAIFVPHCQTWLRSTNANAHIGFPRADGLTQCKVCGATERARLLPDGTLSPRLAMDHDRQAHGIREEPT